MEEYYVLCSFVREGLFNNQRYIIVGDKDEELLVDKSCLKLSLEGIVLAKFNILKIESNTAYGCVINCQDGLPSGTRQINLNNIIHPKNVKGYDGRLQDNLN